MLLDVLLLKSLFGRFSFEHAEPDEGVGDIVVIVDDEEFEFVALVPFDVLFAFSKCWFVLADDGDEACVPFIAPPLLLNLAWLTFRDA